MDAKASASMRANPDRLEHGTRSSYRRGCRCPDCRSANTRYEKRRQVSGAVDLVDASAVRSHLETLQSGGIGPKAISELSGVSLTLVNRLLGHARQRPASRVRPATATALLAVSPGQSTAGMLVPATGTARRLRALVAAGWPQATIARRLGWSPSTVNRLASGRQQQVTAATAGRVARLYALLAQRTGPSSATATRAWLSGWAPADSWTSQSIDDPAASPFGAGLLRSAHDRESVRAVLGP